MKTLLIGPHLDDICLSAAQFLANQPGCHCLTVFSGIPPRGHNDLTPYDAKTGFKSSHRAMESRRLEDRDAMARLKCDPIYWDILDSQYSTDQPTIEELATTIEELAQGYELVLGPLGLVHPDHRLLSDALVLASKHLAAAVYLWEELPNRVLYPEQVSTRLMFLRGQGFDLTLEAPGGAGPMADKVRALLCYRSQLGTGDLDFNLLLVPERFWLIKREGEDERRC